MAEPMMRSDGEGVPEGALAQAADRLDRALARLEARLAAPPPGAPATPSPEVHDALVVELEAARRRQRQLAEAAGAASQALGQAVAQVRRTLDEDAERQGVLDLSGAQGVELQAASPDEGEADVFASEEEPAA